MDDADPYLIAVEQYLYWRELGLTHTEMCEAVGLTPAPLHLKRAETTIRWLSYAYRREILGDFGPVWAA